MLSILLQARDEDGRALTDEELRDELMTLLVAGHETTATTLAWAFQLLLRDRTKLARLQGEIDAGEEDGVYLDAVIKETLRIRPVVPGVIRKLTAPIELAGYELPAGMRVAPNIYLTHRRPDVYPEPERFRPERFLERPAETYSWIPFGGGVRRCLGAAFATYEMKVVIPAILRMVRLQRGRRRAGAHPAAGDHVRPGARWNGHGGGVPPPASGTHAAGGCSGRLTVALPAF